mgnify:FL=1
MGNDNIRLVITWNRYSVWNDATLTTSPTKVEITNMKYIYEQLQFSGEISNAILAETGGVFEINTVGV